MAVKLYLREEYEHPQENKAFRQLCSAGLHYLTDDAAIIGNIPYFDGGRLAGQMDALVLRRTSITIVDFKDVGGSVCISENGKWLTNEGFKVAGGNRDKNPFQQLKRYKGVLASWLSAKGLVPPPNDLGHISGLVVFTRRMAVDDSAMSEDAKKWFCAADQPAAMDFLRDRASPCLELSADCIDRIATCLEAEPFKLLPSEMWVPGSAVERAEQAAYLEAMQDAEDAKQAEWWAKNGDRIRAEYEMACRGWAIHDALADIRRALERRHPGTALTEKVVAALECALGGGYPRLNAVLKAYQPRTEVDLTLALQNRGIEPDDFR